MALFDDELRRAQQFRAQINARDEAMRAAQNLQNRAAANDAIQSQQNQGGLGGVLAGIGQAIGNVGSSLYNMFGTGAASIADLVSGSNEHTEGWKQHMKTLEGNANMSDKEYYNKTAGRALDAASTAADFIPGSLAAKTGFNALQGAASGLAQEYIDNGANADINRALSGALAGGAAAGVGSKIGKGLTNGAIKGNGRIARALNSNVGRGALTGAASGAVGGGLAAALNGQDFIGGALQGAQGGALGGGAMAGLMGLGGAAIDKARNKANPAAANVVNNIPEGTSPKLIEAESTPTRRGIAVTDYDAGEQKVNVRRPNAPTNEYSLGKNAGSTLDGILGPNNKRKLPNAQQPTDAQLLKRATGDYDNAADYLARYPQELETLKQNYPEVYEAVRSGAREMAEANQLAFDGVEAPNKTNLPQLNRQQYYDDTIGKLAKDGGNMRAADVPEYMQSHLREDTTGLGATKRQNDEILREFFKDDTSDLGELYERYAELAQAPDANVVYTPENISGGIRLNGINDDVTEALVRDNGLRNQIEVNGNGGIKNPVNVAVMDAPSNETVYRKSVIAPKTQEQNLPAVRGEVQPSVPESNTPLIQKGSPEYRAIEQQNFIANRQRELRQNIVNGIRDQYGTTRLNDRINGLNDAIMEVANLGLTNRAEIDGFANRITGANGEIPKVIRKSLNDAGKTGGRINMSMQDVYNAAGAATNKDAQKKINTFFESTGKKYKVDANGDMSRLDMYDFGKELEKEGYKMIDRGDRTQQNNTSVYGEALVILSQEYIAKATDGVDIKSNIDVNKLKNILPGNEEWAAKVDNFANNAKTVQDARSFISAPTKMSLLAQAEEYNQGTYGQRVGDMGNAAGRAIRAATSANPINAGAQMAASAIAESRPVSQGLKQASIKRNIKNYKNIEAGGNGRAGISGAVMNAAGAIGDKLGNIGRNLNNDTIANASFNYAGAPTFGDLANRQIARQAGLAAAGDVSLGMQKAEAQNALLDAQAGYQGAMQNYQNAAMQAQQAQNPGLAQLDRIGNAMQLALNAGDIDSYSKLASLYKQAYSLFGDDTSSASQAKALSANQSKALAAQQQLEQLATMTPDAGSAIANSPLGFLVDLTGGNEYANQANALATTLGYLMSGANIKESEAQRIGQAYVPTAFDSEAVRQQKLARARQLVQSYMSSTDSLEA